MERTRVYIKAPFPRQLRAYLVEQEATIGRMYNGTVGSRMILTSPTETHDVQLTWRPLPARYSHGAEVSAVS